MDWKSSWSQAWTCLLMAILALFCLAVPAGAQSAPDFTLKDAVSGKNYSLKQFRGKVVVLNFYTYLCKPCKEEMPALNQLNQEFKGQGLQVIGIGLDSTAEQLRSLAQQLGTSYPVLVGNYDIAKAYGNVEFVPTTFIIDRQGNIAKKVTEAQSKEGFIKLIKPFL
ncbi:MAG: TlpA family protein disulfide reductase [Deltaproteobacteria bacterium]|nr:TlpA family protein disulfide reductase [Deltaproteobacteria bacterium]